MTKNQDEVTGKGGGTGLDKDVSMLIKQVLVCDYDKSGQQVNNRVVI